MSSRKVVGRNLGELRSGNTGSRKFFMCIDLGIKICIFGNSWFPMFVVSFVDTKQGK